jgi:hypothetical protein
LLVPSVVKPSTIGHMSLPEGKPATYADVLALPPSVVGQVINGELVLMLRPASGHTAVASTLSMDLGSPFQRGRGGPVAGRFS